MVGDRFFDRDVELDALEERVRDGTHTLLTAQRRMGKTSLVRELLRRLEESGKFGTVFVDLEAAATPADAVAEIGAQAQSVHGAWRRIRRKFTGPFERAGERVEEFSLLDMRVKLRAGLDAGNWMQKGDGVVAALAHGNRPVVLAIDELPILVNRLLKGEKDHVTEAGRRAADELLSWLRKTGQTGQGRVTMILSGSVGLEPLLEQAGLSAHANIFSPYDLKPWSQETAVSCLGELADCYQIDLPPAIRQEMCKRLRCCIPHHVQMFFDRLHEHLRHARRERAQHCDVEWVYLHEMLSVRGQMDLQHYQTRLAAVLGREGYRMALELITATAIGGCLEGNVVDRYRQHYRTTSADHGSRGPSVDDALRILEHDGYLEHEGGGYRFVSGLLEDWWRQRYCRDFLPRYEVPGSRRRPGQ